MGTETWSLSRRLVTISLGFSFLSCMLSIIAFWLPYWVYFDEKLNVPGLNDVVKLKYNYGFWQYCNDVDSSQASTSNCAKIKTHSDLEQIAVCCVLLSMLLSVNVIVNSALYVTACLNKKFCLYIAVFSAAVSGMLILLSVVSYGSHDHTIKVTDSYTIPATASNLHASFYLAVTACIVITMTVIFIAIALRRHEEPLIDDTQSIWSNKSDGFLIVKAKTILGPFSREAADEESITKKLMQELYLDQESDHNDVDTDQGTDTDDDGDKSDKEKLDEFYATAETDAAFKAQTDEGDMKEPDHNDGGKSDQSGQTDSFAVQIVPLKDESPEDKSKEHDAVSDKMTFASSGLGSSISLLTRKTSTPEITPVETNEGFYPECLSAPIGSGFAPENTLLLRHSAELQSTSFTVRAKTAEPLKLFNEEHGALSATSIHTVEMATTVTTVEAIEKGWVNEKKVYALKQNDIFKPTAEPENKLSVKARKHPGRHTLNSVNQPIVRTKSAAKRKTQITKNKETARRIKNAYDTSAMTIPAYPQIPERLLSGRDRTGKRKSLKKKPKDLDESNA